jgi:hypothetical protein
MLVLADGPGGGTLLDNQESVTACQRALTEQETASWLRRMAGGSCS